MIDPLTTVAVAKTVGKGVIHWIARTLSVLAVIGIGWAIYVMAIKPHINPTPTETQQADNIVNYNYELSPKQTFFGCSNFRIPPPERAEVKK